MKKHKFLKPPHSDAEKEKRAEAFINFADENIDKKPSRQPIEKARKESTKPLYLRSPEGLWEDIHEIMAITGLSMNAICLELLRPAIKQKLKELKE